MAGPVIRGIEYRSPKTDRFKLNVRNEFWITGSDLNGQEVSSILGTAIRFPFVITMTWNDVRTESNSDPGRILVSGIPKRGAIGWIPIPVPLTRVDAKPEEQDQAIQVQVELPMPASVTGGTDPGFVVVTVTGTVLSTFIVQYED
jgi:hypothetical protein